MLVGQIVEFLIQAKDRMNYSLEKQAVEEACNILSKSFNRLDSYEEIINSKNKEKERGNQNE